MRKIVVSEFVTRRAAAAWLNMCEETGEYRAMINDPTKFVVSKTSGELAWNNSRLPTGSIMEEVVKLKGEPGNNFGSGELEGSLQQHGLIDEDRFTVFLP